MRANQTENPMVYDSIYLKFTDTESNVVMPWARWDQWLLANGLGVGCQVLLSWTAKWLHTALPDQNSLKGTL